MLQCPLSRAVKNQAYIDWVRKEVKPIKYKIERGSFTRNWDAVTAAGSGGAVTANDIVVMTQSSPDRCEPDLLCVELAAREAARGPCVLLHPP